MFVWIIVMMFCVFLDQITKYLVVIYMDLHQSISVIPGIFNFTYIRNEGAAFGSMSDSRWVFMVLSTVAIVALVAYLFIKKPKSKLFCTALSMIVGGGIGNMIDRVRLGYVVDFLDFCAFPKLWMWTFNVADAFVCIGAGMLIVWMILDIINESKREKMKLLQPVSEGDGSEFSEISVVDEKNIVSEHEANVISDKNNVGDSEDISESGEVDNVISVSETNTENDADANINSSIETDKDE